MSVRELIETLSQIPDDNMPVFVLSDSSLSGLDLKLEQDQGEERLVIA